MIKVFPILFVTFIATLSQAELRLDCSSFTPKDLRLFKLAPAQDPCLQRGTSVVALVTSGVLYTCDNGKTVESFDVALGRGGLGKQLADDNKTPLGIYSLGPPRVSDRFGLFIPVGYPTREQVSKGFSGSDVGIHGPERTFACAGVLNVSFNWTAGCLAVADDQFIVAISKFVKAHAGVKIQIVNQ